jgi:8-oxo-dGTP diphosphatase
MDLRVSAYGVIVRDDHLLVAHWNFGTHGGWTLPGGGIDPGEDPADAAIREIREETGYDASLDRLLGVDSLVLVATERLDGGPVPAQGIRIIYAASIIGGELTNEADGSTDEARWVPLDEVPNLERVGLIDVGLRMWRDPSQ